MKECSSTVHSSTVAVFSAVSLPHSRLNQVIKGWTEGLQLMQRRVQNIASSSLMNFWVTVKTEQANAIPPYLSFECSM
jgi:hypothetical protein